MNKAILYMITLFFVLGGIDYITGNHFKIGCKFKKGIKAMGALAIGMIGIYSLAPILSKYIAKLVIPLSGILKLDPSVIPTSIFAIDMGGYQMACELAATNDMKLFSGVIVASTLGTVISFTIPVAIGIISKNDQKYFAKGVMIGIIAIPLGCFAAGLLQGINYYELIRNLIPIFIFSIVLVAGLINFPNVLMKAFDIFGKIITALSISGLLLQGIDVILGIKIIKGLAPLSESTYIVGKIAIVLGGAYPMIEIINRIFQKSFEKIGNNFGINSISVAGLLGNLATNLLIFASFKDMNPKGKVIATAFGVSGAFVFGGQLGFVSGVAPQMISAFMVAKFVSGAISVILAGWIYEYENKTKIDIPNMKTKIPIDNV